ncbi:MAG: HigA family addiction module antitoxin [Desulfosalsimonadaceae bacterium]|nr:HigA family addiction module antitoxin [Desulfosalsimonadaceae bacterium]
MHNPPHPGEIIREFCVEPLDNNVTEAARALGVTRKTFSALLNGRSGISPEMALRLSKVFGRTPEGWLRLQLQIFWGNETIPFDILFSTRKTMEIAVHPDQRVTVKVPADTDMKIIQQRMLKRARRIKRQRDCFGQFSPRTPEPWYVGGETHLYMGRQ